MSASIILIYIKLFTFVMGYRLTTSKRKTSCVLAFNRETFQKDLKEIAKRTDLRVIFFPNLIYGSFFTAFLPVNFKDQIKYHLLNSPEELGLKGTLQSACDAVFPLLHKWLRFDAMISANIDYSQDQVWIEAGKRKGVPFIAMVKEGVQSDAHHQWWVYHFSRMKFKFMGERMTVFCQRKKETLLLAEVALEEKIAVVGAPRTDSIFDIMRSQSNNNQRKWVVLFTFNYKAYKRERLWEDTLLAFGRAASELTKEGFQFVVKAREDFDKTEVERFLREQSLIKHVRVNKNISFGDLARKSLLAIGCNTTAIIEMMATDIPIIIPFWAESSKDPLNNMLTGDKATSAYQTAGSPEELIGLVKKVISSRGENKSNGGNLRDARDNVIEKFIYRIDGKRSQAVADVVKQSIIDADGSRQDAEP